MERDGEGQQNTRAARKNGRMSEIVLFLSAGDALESPHVASYSMLDASVT
jgi:hypothetical protein